MNRSLFARRTRTVGLLALLAAVAACGETDGPLAVEDAPTVLFGRVASLTSPVPAATSMAGHAPSTSLAGIEVSVEGGSASTLTDDFGGFRLEARAEDGRLRIRFRRGDLDVRLEVRGLPPGGVFQLEVALDDRLATVLSARDSRDAEFEGAASLVSLAGDAPTRTARVELAGEHGSRLVDIVEGSTSFDAEGDATTFDAMLAALGADVAVKIEGEGDVQDDGSVLASGVKVETDDDADDDDDDEDEGPHEFEGVAALVSVDGDAPVRTARVELTSALGSTLVDVVEGSTAFDAEGDATTFDAMLAALGADVAVKIEGEGEVQDDGSVLASGVKVETDDDAGDDDADEDEGPHEFEGVAALVSVDGDAPMRRARVELTSALGSTLVDVVEGSTAFDAEGDATTFDAMLAALDAVDLVVEIEGQGAVQDDGSVLASGVKVETRPVS